jgi:hypothetical protein
MIDDRRSTIADRQSVTRSRPKTLTGVDLRFSRRGDAQAVLTSVAGLKDVVQASKA